MILYNISDIIAEAIKKSTPEVLKKVQYSKYSFKKRRWKYKNE